MIEVYFEGEEPILIGNWASVWTEMVGRGVKKVNAAWNGKKGTVEAGVGWVADAEEKKAEEKK